MTGPSLPERLAREAEDAPVVVVPADTWARAQRSRRRDALLQLGAAAVVVVAVVGALAWLPGRSGIDAADTDGESGVPSRVHGVPSYVVGEDYDVVRDDLAIGPVAVAWRDSNDVNVLVGADDGAYHLVDLQAAGLNRVAALSPDGGRLAVTDQEARLCVVDLETGEVRPVAELDGALVHAAWSDDGRWLAWVTKRELGRVVVADGVPETIDLPVRPGGPRVAVDDTGTVRATGGSGLATWGGRGDVAQRDVGIRAVSLAVSPGGAELAIGTYPDGSEEVSARFLTGPTVPFGDDATRATAVGWIDDTTSVWRVSYSSSEDELLVVDGDDVRRAGTLQRDYDGNGIEERVVPDDAWIAVGLMTADRPTVDRHEPSWPWRHELVRAVWVLGLTLLAVGLLAWCLVRRRHRDLGRRPRTWLRLLGGVATGAAVLAAWLYLLLVGVESDHPVTFVVGHLVVVLAGLGVAVRSRAGARAFGIGLALSPLLAGATYVVVIVNVLSNVA